MSYFDDASLVMIPSGYKDQKVYSVKPIDGSGDLTFSRASNATRVNSSGLVEKVRTNLFAYSNEFDNAYWTKPQASVVSGQPDPNGGTAAFKLVEDTSTNFHWLLKSGPITGAGEYGLSIFAKPAGRNYIAVGNASLGEYAYFNLSNGTIVSSHPNAVGKIEAVGNGFYRCSVTLLTSSSAATGFFISTDGSTISYTGDGTSGLFIFGAQLENGVTTDYIATTSAAVSVGPVSGLPRLDYSGGASCPSLILEGQRTNLVLYSEQTDNAYWGKYQCTITANDTTSPDGYTNADKITNTISTGSAVVYKALTSIAAGAQTMSFFIKAGTGSVGRLAFYDGTTTFSADYNLTNGTATNVTAGATATIAPYANDWYRCTLTATSVAGTHYLDYGIVNSAIGQYAYIFGLQFESSASYASSYIPSLSTAVTRVDEGPINLGTAQTLNNFTLLFDGLQFENGMLFGGGTSNWYVDIGMSNGRIVLDTNTGRKFEAYSVIRADQYYKLAIKRTAGIVEAFVNGVKLTPTIQVTDTTALSLSSIFWSYSGAHYPKMKVNQMLAFQTALTDSDAITLTTL